MVQILTWVLDMGSSQAKMQFFAHFENLEKYGLDYGLDYGLVYGCLPGKTHVLGNFPIFLFSMILGKYGLDYGLVYGCLSGKTHVLARFSQNF